MKDDEKNGGGAQGGGWSGSWFGPSGPECALDGLFHEVEANWNTFFNIQKDRLIIHIYDYPPHGNFQESKPDEHCDFSPGDYCCCCNDKCEYNKKKGKGWTKLIKLMKNKKIQYQALCTNPDLE